MIKIELWYKWGTGVQKGTIIYILYPIPPGHDKTQVGMEELTIELKANSLLFSRFDAEKTISKRGHWHMLQYTRKCWE